MRDSYYLRVLTHFPWHNVRPTLLRDLCNIFLSRIRKKVRFIATTFCISHLFVTPFMHRHSLLAQRITFIQKVHCITSTKYLFIYLEYKNYNPGQNSWDTNAIARQIEAPSLPPFARCSVDTIKTAWGRGGQQKQPLITTSPSFFKRQNMS